MTERPIIFNGDMVRAILSGQKTQTRRPVKPIPVYPDTFDGLRREIHDGQVLFWAYGAELPAHIFRCPCGQPGDRLWVRETFREYYPKGGWPAPKALYKADGIARLEDTETGKTIPWRASIHMPRSLSRITLEITDINVERVQDITEEEVIKEGVVDPIMGTYGLNPITIFSDLWETLYARRGSSWKENPWVWAITFRRVEQANAQS